MKQRLGGLIGVVCLGAAASVAVPAFAGVDPNLPDLVPTGLTNFMITNRFCGETPTFEFSILTANIGGQDWTRPLTPDGTLFRMRQIYEYVMYNWQQVGTNENGGGIFDWVEIDRRRKNTICTIDSQVGFSCLVEHAGTHTCSSFPRQGISRGWADSYYRGLTGQYSCLFDYTGDFLMQAQLDPDLDLADDGILPAESIDATHDDNWVDLYFSWDGTAWPDGFTYIRTDLYFDPAAACG